jgi:hypothetical protein
MKKFNDFVISLLYLIHNPFLMSDVDAILFFFIDSFISLFVLFV